MSNEPLQDAVVEPGAPEAAVRPYETEPKPETARYLNRELQWLEFNERVLAQALDERVPVLERVRFLSIHANNLDEFYMKRVGGLRRQLDAGVLPMPPETLAPAQQLTLLRERLLDVTRREADCYRNVIVPALRNAGVHLLEHSELTRAEVRVADEWYRKNAFPILTPLAVDPGHRFPFISNLSVSLGIVLRRPGDSEQLFARVKVPQVLPQWVRVGTNRFVALREIIERNLADLFPGMEILKVLAFRVTRNADIAEDNEDAEDLLESIQQQLRQRRFAPVVRLQVGRKPNRRLMEFLCDELEIRAADIYETPGLIEYVSLSEIANLDLPDLRYPSWRPMIPPQLSDADQDIFSAIRQGDILVHHPYESFDRSVERFIEEASADPNVLGIKQALYRTSGDSPFVRELIRAAEAGKQVAVLVEVRARFDEASNIEWARKLEEVGVHVAYGVVGLKTHTKIALVVRREPDGLRSYAHISTGNYNSKTAQIYEDVGLFTCDPALCDDVIDLFNAITGRCRQPDYTKLIVAPFGMRTKFVELIHQEIAAHSQGKPARIVAKMNQLQDQDIIEALYRASQAGIQVNLIVRGFCTLRPGVPGLSENITVHSIIGRFLEHSRIFYFRNGAADPCDGQFYIGSADWMYRNLSARVEAACPIEDRTLRKRLWEYLNVCMEDRRQGWEMNSDGRYRLRQAKDSEPQQPAGLGTHQTMMNLALQRASIPPEAVEGD
ncbi:MAG: polyphosphate kinase 1 [Phycisphaerales bacterium]|nr:polyphosphate kinase 1 [Phycisphaerales bacterium]MCI0675864.1 polyphosphate kinase 1 [Phycisphaerales bacterium]